MNDVINSMWWGDSLGLLGLLTVNSFHAHGHPFHLWLYEDVSVPDFVVKRDASEIMPSKELFQYHNICPNPGGNKTGAADIFRLKLLHETGGWWVDMDVTCLKPFDVSEDYFFRSHWKCLTVGNAFKVPPRSQFTSMCYQEYCKQLNEDNTDWHLSTQIMSDCVIECGLRKFIRHGVANQDNHQEMYLYTHIQDQFPEAWMLMHWCNSHWLFDDFNPRSAFGRLVEEYISPKLL